MDNVGNTPLISLSRIAKDVAPVSVWGKAEFLNPGGSVKDRPALRMIQEGERSGELTSKKTILDATSGNTGVAYAMFGAAMGYKVKLVVPQNISRIRLQVLKAYGADIALSNPQKGSDGAIEEAQRLYQQNPHLYFYPDQYNNENNWKAHYEGTGPEILQQTQGKITHFVAGLGTTGTFMGTGRHLKEVNKEIQLISFQPDSPMHGLEGLKHMPTSLVPGIYDHHLADETDEVQTEEAQRMVKRMAQEEGLLVGLSAGAALVSALRLAQKLTAGVIVTMLCDTGQRYLDMAFWEH